MKPPSKSLARHEASRPLSFLSSPASAPPAAHTPPFSLPSPPLPSYLFSLSLPPLPFRAFAAALEYAQTFGGVVAGASPAAVDDLIFNLRNVQFDHEDGAGGITKVALHEYEVVALCNLNPAGTAAAKALLPSLERFAEDEVGEILTLLRKAHTRAGVAAALGGGAGGALA